MSRKRSAYRPRPVFANAVEVAINGRLKLPDADRRAQMASLQATLREFSCGQRCEMHWPSLADAANMAETLCTMGLGSGAEAEDVIRTAQRVLHDVLMRHRTRGTWTMYADEIDALHWLLSLHGTQLEHCTRGEFARAMDKTAERIRQARTGNAPRDAIVVEGVFGAARH